MIFYLWNDSPREGVDDVVPDLAELLVEGLGAPQVGHVELVRDIRHDHGLAAAPLLLKEENQRLIPKFEPRTLSRFRGGREKLIGRAST